MPKLKSVENRYKIFLGANSEVVERAPNQSIVIYPKFARSHGWNDFGYETQYMYTVIDKKQPALSSPLFFSFLDIKDTPWKEEYHNFYDANSVLLHHFDRGEKLIPESKLPIFFTMLPDMQAYRQIVSIFGEKEAQYILFSMRDLVALKEFLKLPSWYKSAIKSNSFNLSFLRNSKGFFAYHNAGSILRGLDKEKKGQISTKIFLRFKLPTFDNDHYFDFIFKRNELLPTNIAIIIGQNGLGKSQSLNKIATAALRGDQRALSAENGSRILLNKLIAIAAPGETNNTFPPERKNSYIPYKKINLGRNVRKKNLSGIGDTIIQLLRSGESIAGERRFDIFLKAISKFIEIDKIGLRIDTSDSTHDLFKKDIISLDKLDYGGEQNFLEICKRVKSDADPVRIQGENILPLSSGQITFLKFIAAICIHIENGSLLLLDEPETHLHPNLIAEFSGILNTLLDATGSIAILATHSVYFVREVPREQVHVLKNPVSRIIEVIKPRLKTMGAEIGAISYFVFEDETSSRLIYELQRKLEPKSKNTKQKFLLLRNELPSEVLIKLAQHLKIKL